MEESQEGLPNHIKTLSAAEVLISRGLALADATPFLAVPVGN